MNIKTCIEKGFLVKSKKEPELGSKEFKEADYDFDSAQRAFSEEDYKWCIIKCYYSMFHAAKSVLYQLGYTEKKHVAVIVVLEELSREGKIENKHVVNFKAAISAREDADYHYSYSKATAEHDLEIAEEFISMTKTLLRKI